MAGQCSIPDRHFRHPWHLDAGGRTPKVGALGDAWSSWGVFEHCPDDVDFSVRWNRLMGYFSCNVEKGEVFQIAGNPGGKEEFGSADSGSIYYAIKLILIDMSTLFIGIR